MAQYKVIRTNNADVFMRQVIRDAKESAGHVASGALKTAEKQAEQQSQNTVTDGDTQKVIRPVAHAVVPIGESVNKLALTSSYKRLALREIEATSQINTDVMSTILSKYATVSGTESVKNRNEIIQYTVSHNTDALLSKTITPAAMSVNLKHDYKDGLVQNGLYMKKVNEKKEIKSGIWESVDTYQIIDLRTDTSSTARAYRLMAKELKHEAFWNDAIEIIPDPFSNEPVKTLTDFESKIEYQKYVRAHNRNVANQLLKRADKLDELSKTTSKALKKQKLNTRLIEDVYRGSETMQGYSLARSGTGMVTAAATGTGLVSSYVGVQTYRVYAATKEAKTYIAKQIATGETPLEWKDAFKLKLDEVDKIHGTQGLKIGGRNSAAQFVRKKVKDDVMEKVTGRMDALSKQDGMFQNAAKQWIDAHERLVKPIEKVEMQQTETTLTKITINAIKTATKDTVTQTKVGKTVWNATEIPFEAIRTVKEIIKPVKDKIGDTLSALLAPFKFITKWLFKIVAAVVFIFVILELIITLEKMLDKTITDVLSGAMGDVETVDILNVDEDELMELEASWNDSLKQRGTKIMNTLDNCHDDFMNKLNEIRLKYDTTDTQYPSGSIENYKEIFCAAEVMCNYDFDSVTDAELQGWVNDLYERTHIITEEPYDFQYADGTWGEACHIYVDIQRDEMLAYSAMEGVATGSGNQVGITAGNCPKGIVVNEDWMNVVRTLKTLIAQTNASYNQSTYLPIGVNDAIYTVRTDCSGYVSACLWASGASPIGTNWNSQSLLNAASIPGFVKYTWNGWDNLQEGDIIAYGEGGKKIDANGSEYYGWSGHTEIFAYNSNGKHYVYSNGSTNSLRSAVPTVAGNHGYTASNTCVWRPINPGSSSTTVDVAGAVDITMDFAEYFELPFYDNGTAVILFSNQAGVTFNEETGNEDGYETALAATVNAEIASTQFFTASKFDAYNNMKPHTLDKDTTSSFVSVSSYDFVRYIAARHGVTLPLDYFEEDIDSIETDLENVTVATMKPGDILFYIPQTIEINNSLVLAPYSYGYGSKQFELIKRSIIPMICCEDGTVVAYSRNALCTLASYDASSAYIRKYNVSDLNQEYIFDIIRPSGYTIAETYGANGTFAGWNDENIKGLLYLLKGEQWETGTLVKAFAEDLGGYEIKLDYTPFYYEEMNEGNYYDFTNAHSNTFKHDVLLTALKFYNEYGILPSTAYTHSFIVSENRSTEESLLYYNIFEKYTLNEDNGVISTKYNYTSDGDVSSKDYLYKKYDSYEAAYRDLYQEYMNGKSGILFKTTFNEQLYQYASYSVLNNAVRAKMQQAYNMGANSDLANWDQLAVKRKEAIDLLKGRIELLTRELPNMYHNTSSEYYYLNKLIRITQESYTDLVNLLNTQNSNTPLTDELCAQSQSILASATTLSEAKWDWYASNPYRPELFISAICNGHMWWHSEVFYNESDCCDNCTKIYNSETGNFESGWCRGHGNGSHGTITDYNTYIACGNATNPQFEIWYYGHCAE